MEESLLDIRGWIRKNAVADLIVKHDYLAKHLHQIHVEPTCVIYNLGIA